MADNASVIVEVLRSIFPLLKPSTLKTMFSSVVATQIAKIQNVLGDVFIVRSALKICAKKSPRALGSIFSTCMLKSEFAMQVKSVFIIINAKSYM